MKRLKLQRLKGFYNVLWKHRTNNKIWFAPNILRRKMSTIDKSHPEDITSISTNKALQRIVLVLSVLASFIGCSYHIWYISDIYFKYDVIRSISIGTYDDFELPAITLCVGLQMTFNKEKWFRRFKAKEIEIGKEILDELTIQEIDYMGPDMERDGIIGYAIGSHVYEFEELEQWRPTVKSIHVEHDLKCETYYLRKLENSNVSYSGQTTIKVAFNYFDEDYASWVNGSQPNIYRVYVHPSSQKFRISRVGIENEFFEFRAREFLSTRLTSSTRSTFLPAPYKTNCYNYSEHNPISNRADCVHNCLLREYREYTMSGEWPYFLPIYMDDVRFNWTTLRAQVLTGATKVVMYALHTEYESHCQKNDCEKADCVQNHIGLRLLNSGFTSDNSTSLEIQFPSEPTRTYSSNPKIELVEYLSYVAGVLSLAWYLSIWFIYIFWRRISKSLQAEKF